MAEVRKTQTKKPTVKKATAKKTSVKNKASASKKEVLLSIKGLHTSFSNKGSGKKVVHSNLDLDLYEGETLSIIGVNGAGKTVLAETIVGIREIQKGVMIEKEGFDRKLNSGIQFQSEDNPSDLIKPKNLISFYKKFYKNIVSEEHIKEMIQIFGIEEFLNRKMNKLSGGQKQRLNLLLSVISKPKLLVLDEFTTGLDIASVIDILEYITNFVKENNSTLVVITHNAKEIKMMADRVVLIKDGIATNEITTKQINTKYKGDFDQYLIDQIRGN